MKKLVANIALLVLGYYVHALSPLVWIILSCEYIWYTFTDDSTPDSGGWYSIADQVTFGIKRAENNPQFSRWGGGYGSPQHLGPFDKS